MVGELRGTTGLASIDDGTERHESINIMFEVFEARCYTVNRCELGC